MQTRNQETNDNDKGGETEKERDENRKCRQFHKDSGSISKLKWRDPRTGWCQ